jgi:alpha-glucosidase
MPTSTVRWAVAALISFAGLLAAGAQQVTPLPAGMRTTSNGVTLEVTAVRDDVLRVRMWKGDSVPEDASWAVLPAARTSSVAVAAEPQGFSTKALRVTVDDQLRVAVADLGGNVLAKDAAPVLW